MTQRRCAIYTRKSSEEGLEQEFNSLHAQREACEAYIKSQAHEGWRLVKTAYDDGGFSGGSMERPALARLLADIGAGQVDIVVVYKVDRLTRSLSDFARIVETLDRQGASFVSVTQQFNTTSSMGRLTLNVLLSFAQFEREVTSERIRDKIAASKARGMWMGGMAPLGYDIQDRKLVVNDAEAEIVRTIFQRYVDLGTVTALVDDLKDRRIRTKIWTPLHGRPRGGQAFDRLILYRLLKNELYIGRIAFKGHSHEGQHQAIIPTELWEQVQARLATNRSSQGHPRSVDVEPLLTGLLFDDRGNRMSPAFARKANGQRYNYYVSQPLLTGQPEQAGSVGRVPTHDLDQLVRSRIEKLLNHNGARANQLHDNAHWREAIQKVKVDSERVVITAIHQESAPSASQPADQTFRTEEIVVPIVLGRRGRRSCLAPADAPAQAAPRLDRALIRALARALYWRELLENGGLHSMIELARVAKRDPSYVRNILQLAFIAPALTETIMLGCQTSDITLSTLLKSCPPLLWYS